MANEFSRLKLNLDLIANNPNNKVMVTIGGFSNDSSLPSVLSGFANSDFRFSGGNQYNTPLDNDITNTLNQTLDTYKTSISQVGGNLANFQVKTQIQTVLNWVGSDRFSFNLDLLFIAYKRNDNSVLPPIKLLLSAITPLSTGDALISNLNFENIKTSFQNIKSLVGSGDFKSVRGLNFITIAPRGYRTFIKKDKNGVARIEAEGLSAIQIGKWFKADQMVIKTVGIGISKETIANGNPLYATANIQFESFKMLDELEVLNMIVAQT